MTQRILAADESDAFVLRCKEVAGVHGPTLASNSAEVSSLSASPVYPDVKLFEVDVQLRQRPLVLLVAEVAGELVLLGSSEGVETLNRRVGLELTSADEVAHYIRFWFWATSRGGESLVETSADLNWLPEVQTDPEMSSRSDRAAHLVRRVTVGHPAHGAYPAEVTALDQRTLELRHLRVLADGHVEETIREPLMEQVPVPYVMP